MAQSLAIELLEQEAYALRGRLACLKPLALLDASVPAASITPHARHAIDRRLTSGHRELRQRVTGFLHSLRPSAGRAAPTPAAAQRRFTFLRLRFNALLTQFDIFADAVTQRSEADTGVWLGGLDALARDALALPGFYRSPELICYLDRGGGAAIRRARTRLPGGGSNPVAIIRVPRERMIGAAVASSLVHEVGHQAAALLSLVESLRTVLRPLGQRHGAFLHWERWISEIVADLWSVARLGISSTTGLIGVMSLPSAFVFRGGRSDPHPIPWIRVLLSCAMGQSLYPHSQWTQLAQVWQGLYPRAQVPLERRKLFLELEASLPDFVGLLTAHRPKSLRGASLREVLDLQSRKPARLSELHDSFRC